MLRPKPNKFSLKNLICVLWIGLTPGFVHAEIIDKKQTLTASNRNFYDVLGVLIAELEADIEKGDVPINGPVKIRRLRFSENIPKSFANHLKFLIAQVFVEAEPLKKPTTQKKTRQQAYPVKTKKKEQKGIDIVLTLQKDYLLLSIHLVNLNTLTSLWTGNYDSSKVHASRPKRSSVTDLLVKYNARKTVFHPVIYSSFHQSDGQFVSTLLPAIRILERYDYGRLETGLELGGYIPTKLLVGNAAAITSPSEQVFANGNVHLMFHHGWNLIRDASSLKSTRGTLYVGAGLTYFFGAALSPWARLGLEWRFSEHWTASSHLGYRFPVNAKAGSTVFRFSGIEIGLSVGFAI